MIPLRTDTRDNPTLEGSARVCVAGSPVPPLWALGLAVLTLLLSAILALVPFGIHVGISETCDSTNITRGVYLDRCEAFALTPGDTAKEFIKKMASASGISAGDLIVTSVGVAAIGSGMQLASETGQNWGRSAAESLSGIVEAADYPNWETLSQQQQTLWGSKENYDSAKYVTLMNAFGYETEYERFEQITGSGGSNFEFSEDAKDRLQQFYRICNLWKSRLGVTFQDIVGLITDLPVIQNFPAGGGGDETLVFDATDEEDWPSGIPETLYIGYGTELQSIGTNADDSLNRYYVKTSIPVYWLVLRRDNSGRNSIDYIAFSKSDFDYGNGTNYNNINVTVDSLVTNDGNWHVVLGRNQGLFDKSYSCNMPVNIITRVLTNNEQMAIVDIILGASFETGSSSADSIVDYPTDGVPLTERIYYPEGGMSSNTPWQDFTTPQIPIRDNETPYNPGNQTQTVEWQTQTEENVLPLLDIKFDKLFPFSMLSDIPKLFDKVELLTGGEAASGVYNRVEIPLNWGQNHEDDIVLDLTWLYDLLNMIRPAMQVLLVAFLLITCIEFWRGILTG